MLLNCDSGKDPWESPCTERRSNQSIIREINLEYSLEALMLKLQYFGHVMQRANSLEKTDAGKDWRQEEKGTTTENEVVGWNHWLDGHGFELTPGDSEGQGSLGAAVHGVIKNQTGLTDWTTMRYTESERIHHQQTCTTRTIKGNPSGRQKISDGNTNLNKPIKNARNGTLYKYVRSFYYLTVFKR